MSGSIGKKAVVIGAGMAGLAAAKALSAHFEHVSILERDALPVTPAHRPGTPQAQHPHGLLAGGLSPLPTNSCHFAHGIGQASAGMIEYSVMWEAAAMTARPAQVR